MEQQVRHTADADAAREAAFQAALSKVKSIIDSKGYFQFRMPAPDEYTHAVRTQVENVLTGYRAEGLDIPDVKCRTKYQHSRKAFVVTLSGPAEQLHTVLDKMFPPNQPVATTLRGF